MRKSPQQIAAQTIRAAKIFYFAEYAGGLFYRQFAANLANAGVKETFERFSHDEYDHAGWYAEWLHEHGATPPSVAGITAMLVPAVRAAMAPLTLEGKLQVFAQTEAMATRHLTKIAPSIQDPALRAIVEKTIPFEYAHSKWYERDGRRMLRSGEQR